MAVIANDTHDHVCHDGQGSGVPITAVFSLVCRALIRVRVDHLHDSFPCNCAFIIFIDHRHSNSLYRAVDWVRALRFVYQVRV